MAYAMRYVRAASEEGAEFGFKAAHAQRIAMQTMKDAAYLMMPAGKLRRGTDWQGNATGETAHSQTERDRTRLIQQ